MQLLSYHATLRLSRRRPTVKLINVLGADSLSSLVAIRDAEGDGLCSPNSYTPAARKKLSLRIKW